MPSDPNTDKKSQNPAALKNSPSTLQNIQTLIDDTKTQVYESIEKVIDRGEKLEDLEKRAEALADDTRLFNRKSEQVKKEFLDEGYADPSSIIPYVLGFFNVILLGAGLTLAVLGGKAELMVGLYLMGSTVLLTIIETVVWKCRNEIKNQFNAIRHLFNVSKKAQVNKPQSLPQPSSERLLDSTDASLASIHPHVSKINVIKRFQKKNKIDQSLISKFEHAYQRLKLIDIYQWPLSLREEIHQAVDLPTAVNKATPLYERISRNKKGLDNEDREVMQQCIDYEQTIQHINTFFKNDYHHISLMIHEIKEDANDFFECFTSLLKANMDERYLDNLDTKINISGFIDHRFHAIIIDRVKQSLHGHETLTPHALTQKFNAQWPTIIDHIFWQSNRVISDVMRESNSQWETVLANASTKHPLFWAPKNIVAIRAFDQSSQSFSSDDSCSIETRLKEKQKNINKALRHVETSDEKAPMIHRLKNQVQDYHEVLTATQENVNTFVEWFLQQQANFTVLLDFLDNFDNTDPSVQGLAHQMKHVLYNSIMQAFGKGLEADVVDGKSNNDFYKDEKTQKILINLKQKAMEGSKEKIQTCLKTIQNLKANDYWIDKGAAKSSHKVEAGKVLDPLSSMVRYVKVWQNCQDGLDNIHHQSDRIDDLDVKKQITAVSKDQRSQFRQLINKPYQCVESYLTLSRFHQKIKGYEAHLRAYVSAIQLLQLTIRDTNDSISMIDKTSLMFSDKSKWQQRLVRIKNKLSHITQQSFNGQKSVNAIAKLQQKVNQLTQVIQISQWIDLIEKPLFTVEKTKWAKQLQNLYHDRGNSLVFQGKINTLRQKMNHCLNKTLQEKQAQLDNTFNYLGDATVFRNRLMCMAKNFLLPADVKAQIHTMLKTLINKIKHNMHLSIEAIKKLADKHLSSSTVKAMQIKINLLNELSNINLGQMDAEMNSLNRIINFVDYLDTFNKHSIQLDKIYNENGRFKDLVTDLTKCLSYERLCDICSDETKWSLYYDISNFNAIEPTIKAVEDFNRRVIFLKDIVIKDQNLLKAVESSFSSSLKDKASFNKTIENALDDIHDAIKRFQTGAIDSFFTKSNHTMNAFKKNYFTDIFEEKFNDYEMDEKYKLALINQIAEMIEARNDESLNEIFLEFKNSLSDPVLTLQAVFDKFQKKNKLSFAHFVTLYGSSEEFIKLWQLIPLKNQRLIFNTPQPHQMDLSHMLALHQPGGAFIKFWDGLSSKNKNLFAQKKIQRFDTSDEFNYRFSLEGFYEREVKWQYLYLTPEREGWTVAHLVVHYQLPEIFQSFWKSLNNGTQNSLAKTVTNGISTGEYWTVPTIVLINQPPEVFLEVWKSLTLDTRKQLLTDPQLFSPKEKWSLFQWALIHLPKKSFKIWMSTLKALNLSSEVWERLLVNTKDSVECCVLDIAACYHPVVLPDLLECLPTAFDWKKKWVDQSPLVQSVMTKTPALNVNYRGWLAKDATDKTQLTWVAHQGNGQRVEDYKENHMPNFFWQYVQGSPLVEVLREAMHTGDFKLFQSTKHLLNGDIYFIDDAVQYIKKNGFSTMKPIIDELLLVKSRISVSRELDDGLIEYTADQLTWKLLFRYGYWIDETNPAHPEIRQRKSTLLQVDMNDSIENKKIQSVSISKNQYALLPTPKITIEKTSVTNEKPLKDVFA